ncbi:MAG: 16S rRNA (cytosine(1402)-N(4))-methyltransferase RsmH [Candidatus Zhuqueibacterota bacterium]
MTEIDFHIPVLVDPVLKFLVREKSGIYVDGTVGGGGHSLAILESLSPDAKLIAIDQDDEALARAEQKLVTYKNKIRFIKGNFSQIQHILSSEKIGPVDGILLDLGVSSHHLDADVRGFSFMADGPLDMRMSRETEITAEDVINDFSEAELVRIFREYGEERYARNIASVIVRERQKQRITSTAHLAAIITAKIPYQKRIKTLARIFQSVRIAVNSELENLQQFLDQSLDVLKIGGRLVIIAYHSLEDRLVKNFMTHHANPCECPPELPFCICNKKPTIQILTRKVIQPSPEEIESNSRSRSAKLRAAEKI